MNNYGVKEVNPINKDMQDEFLHSGKCNETVSWDDPRLAKIERLRLLTDPGFPMYDVSYCWGRLKDGTPVRVSLPFFQLEKRYWKTEIVKWAKRDGVHAKRLGVFDAISSLS